MPFKEQYAIRSCIEATNAELKTAHELGKVRSQGKNHVTLGGTMKALTCNVKQYMNYKCIQVQEKSE